MGSFSEIRRINAKGLPCSGEQCGDEVAGESDPEGR